MQILHPRRMLGGLILLFALTCVAFGLAISIAAYNGVESEFDQLVNSIGANLFRVMGAEGQIISGTPTSASVPFSQSTLDQLRAGPGIAEVAAATDGIEMSGVLRYLGVTPSYFSVQRLSLLSGRAFREGETGVCVLSYAYAEAAYPDQDSVGQVLKIGSDWVRDLPPNQYRIVGVLNPMPLELDSMWYWSESLRSDVLLPVEDFCALFDLVIGIGDCSAAPYANLWIRVDPSNPRQGIESILSILPPGSHLDSISTLYGFTFRLRRRIVGLYLLAALALLFVAGVTVFAMSMTQVARQAQAIGIRRALGAPRSGPGTGILLRLIGYALVGLVIGTSCAFWLSPALSRLLSITLRFGSLHLAGAAVLLGVTALAGLIPTLHASRVPPVRAIRSMPLRFERSPLRGVGWLVTAAGVVGIASVVFVASLSDSLNATLRDLYGNLEPNIVAARGGSLTGSAVPPFDLTRQDIDAISALPSVLGVTGELMVVMSEALRNDEPVAGRLIRVQAFGQPFFAGRLVTGRLPTSREMSTGAPVALVGTAVAERGLGAADPTGQQISINGQTFEVIGVFDSPKVSFDLATPGWKILVPAEALEDTNNDRYFAWVKMNPTYSVEETIDDIRELVAARHPGAAPLRIEGPATEMGKMISVANGITFGLLRLGYLTLLVSTFALGSLFWAQTIRRQGQIALERALGATSLRVFWGAFRVAFATTCLAGLIALGIGVMGTFFVRNWFWNNGDFRFDLVWILWAIAAVLSASVIGGGLPALWASRLSPMEGIRKGRL